MNLLENSSTRFDRAALSVSLLLGLLITLFALLAPKIALRATLVEDTPPGTPRSPKAAFTLRFRQPPQISELAQRVQVSSGVSVTLQLRDAFTVDVIPNMPLLPGETYTLTLRDGNAWQFAVRQPLVVYVSELGGGDDLWITDLQGNTRQLTFTAGKLFDFAAAPDGEWVAYSAVNDAGGIDLWRTRRDGAITQPLLLCGMARCTAPNWSPDGALVAYSRQEPPDALSLMYAAPRAWLLNVLSGQTRPLFGDSQILGYAPQFSPLGRWVTTFDGVNDRLRIFNLLNGQTIFLESNTGALPAWSPDEQFLFYTHIEVLDQGYRTLIYRADFSNGETGVFLGDDEPRDYGYTVPAVAPNGAQLVFGLRADEQFNQHLWLVSADFLGGPMVAAETGFSYRAYRWDVWGQRLVFERADSTQNYRTGIAIWEAKTGLRVLVAHGRMPQWMP